MFKSRRGQSFQFELKMFEILLLKCQDSTRIRISIFAATTALLILSPSIQIKIGRKPYIYAYLEEKTYRFFLFIKYFYCIFKCEKVKKVVHCLNTVKNLKKSPFANTKRTV